MVAKAALKDDYAAKLPSHSRRPARNASFQTGAPDDWNNHLTTRALKRDEVRDVDRRAIEEYGLPGMVLMENAGRNAAELLVQLGISGPVLICAGKGNNGGDGFVIARHLDVCGFTARVLLFADPEELAGDAAINYRVLQTAGIAGRVMGNRPVPKEIAQELAAAEWVVDALLGTGARGTLREPFLSAIAGINQSGKKVFAVDLPSGMDCDTGESLSDGAGGKACVRADHTATFVATKWGFTQPGADKLTGQVHVLDIGVPRRLLADVLQGPPGGTPGVSSPDR